MAPSSAAGSRPLTRRAGARAPRPDLARRLRACFVVVSVVLLCFRPIFPFSSFLPFLFIGGFDSSALCRSRRELSNEYLLAKVGVDTAENEPLAVRGKIFNIIVQYYSIVSFVACLGAASLGPQYTDDSRSRY